MADIKTITLPDNNIYHFRDDRIEDSDITRWDAASGGLTIDEYLDGDSTNPVQNKAIMDEFLDVYAQFQPKLCRATSTTSSISSGTSITQLPLNSWKFRAGDSSRVRPAATTMFTFSSNGIKVNYPGYYRITGSAIIKPVSGTTRIGTYIMVGSSFSAADELTANLSSTHSDTGQKVMQTASIIEYLHSGDIVFLGSRCMGAAGTVVANHWNNWLQLEFVGD